jgi:hypothetical protein
MSLRALPIHEPCGADGSGELILETMAIVCTVRRTFAGDRLAVDAIGCGRVSRLDPHSGLRVFDDVAPESAEGRAA